MRSEEMHNERSGLIEEEPLFSAASYNYSPDK